jgi:phage terminase large subunit GpA-like protein
MALIDDIAQQCAEVWTPPPDLTVSEWADRFRVLSSESSAEPGRWRTDRAPYQRGIMDAASDPTVREVVVMSSAQIGKALALDTPIATPSGWKTMGALVVGDYVFGMNGHPVRVGYVSPVMFDRRCYAVGFSDGARIVADADHKWLVDSDVALTKGQPWKGAGEKSGILTTEQIAKTATYGKKGRNRYAIPVASPLALPDADLEIDPYVLGAWLGDGHSASARIFASFDDADFMAAQIDAAGHRVRIIRNKCAEIMIDPLDSNICQRGHDKNSFGRSGNGCAECGRIHSKNSGRRKRGIAEEALPPFLMTLSKRLTEMSLLGNKHIPQKYLRASESQRMALLQGLMDTDGCVSKNGRCEFVTTSEAIRDGMRDLLAGLGIKFTCTEKQPQTKYKGETVLGATAWRFSFLVYSDCKVFRMPRKLARMVSEDGRRTTETRRRRVVSVDPVESVPVRCIMVESEDHLFLAGAEMVPTHNTEFLLNIVGFYIHQDPSPIMLLQPTLDMAESFSKDRLAPMVRDTPALQGKIADARARDSGNTLLHKKFPGGQITMAGANSPASLASRPIRVVMCDEVDRYPMSAGTEGDPVSLAKKRTATFWNRKVVLVSTPTIAGVSRIEAAFNQSDQRRYHVPCPHCDHLHTLSWRNVVFDPEHPRQAQMVCPSCGSMIADQDKPQMLARGKWIATAPHTGVAGFHLNELYSPWRRFGDVVADFVAAKDFPEKLKTWVNTSLGEVWEDREGDAVDADSLMARKGTWTEDALPADTVAVFVGADTQDDRLEATRVAVLPGLRLRIISHHVMTGSPAEPAVWQQMDAILSEVLKTEDGRTVTVHAACIDAGGHHASAVLDYCEKRRGRRVWAIRGRAGPNPIWPKRYSRSQKHKNKHQWMIGVDTAKDWTHSAFAVTNPDMPHHIAFSADISLDERYFRQLTEERRSIRYDKQGRPVRTWKARPGARVEAGDCLTYAVAALHGAIEMYRFKAVVAPSKPEKAQAAAEERRAERAAAKPTPTPKPARPLSWETMRDIKLR